MILAATVYAGLAFCAGMALGVVRGLIVAPAIGPVWAVAVEALPILTACWFACQAAIAWTQAPPAIGARICLGFLWFALMQGLEIAVGGWLRGWSVTDWFARLWTLEGAMALALFAIAAAFPLLQSQRSPNGNAA
jgi:hypothetical protein